MRKILNAMALAIGLSGTAAQAQTKPDIQCLDTQVKVVSALALAQGGNGVVDCREATPISHVLVADASQNIEKTPTIPRELFLDTDNGNQFSFTPFTSTHGTGVAGTVVLGGEDLSVGLKADGTSEMKHGTLGVATRVGDSATVSLTVSGAHEDAGIALGNKDFDGITLKGEQFMLGLDGANVGPFKTAGISLGAGTAHATELGSTTALTTDNRVVDTPTATENWRDTYSTKTTTNYSGSTWNSIGVRGVVDVGTQGELSLRGGAYTNNIMGNTATGGVGYTHYMGTDGKVEVSVDRVGDNTISSAKYTKPLSEGWALTAGVSHLAGVVNDTKAMVGLVWTPGAKSSYTRPIANDALDANKIVARNLSSAENNLQGLGAYGKVETTTGPKILTGSEKTGEILKDQPGSASITGPITSMSGPITLNLSANDANDIVSWTVTSVRLRNTGISDPAVTEGSGAGNPPATLTTNIGGNVGNTYTYTLTVVDKLGNSTSNQFVVTRN